MQQISPALQTKLQNIQQSEYTNQSNPTGQVDLTTKPDSVEISSKDNKKKKVIKVLAIIAGVSAAITAVVLFARHKLSLKAAQEAIRKNTEIESIFKNIKGVPDKLTGEKISVDELMEKYLHDYDMTGKTLYHGTGFETAKIIKEKGIQSSARGGLLGKFTGGYFSEQSDIAERYAKQAARRGKTVAGFLQKPIEVTAGGIVQATLPDGSKLAQFTNNEGKFVSMDLLEDILKTPEMSEAIKNANLKNSDVVEFLQNLLIKKGYDGIRHYECHTGATPIIFNRDKLQYGDIIKI